MFYSHFYGTGKKVYHKEYKKNRKYPEKKVRCFGKNQCVWPGQIYDGYSYVYEIMLEFAPQSKLLILLHS